VALTAAELYPKGLTDEDAARLPYYASLLAALSRSALACDLLESVPLERRNPILVPDVMHLLALRGVAPYDELYATREGRGPEAFAQGLVAALEADPDGVAAELGRTVQTNEVGRSAAIARVLAGLRSRGHERVHLVDVGTSMGLNLYPDLLHHGGPASDPLALSPEELGTQDPAPLPDIVERVGIDRSPLDPRRPEDVEWLRACLWPEEADRVARLDSMLEATAGWPPTRRVAADALEGTAAVLEALPAGATPVVIHTWVAAYFPPELQRAWRAAMLERVARGAVWAYLEFPPTVPGLEPPEGAPSPRPSAAQVVVADGGEPEPWGWSHHHGRWVALTPPRA
jgi:hypothetical protein